MAEHYTLTVYEGDDTTVAFEVGTDPTHAAPYLHWPEGGESGSVDLVHGGAAIGQYNLAVIDPQSGATQAHRWLTERLSTASGHSALIRHRAVLKRGAVTVMDGVLSRVVLSQSFAGFEVDLRDIRERARKVKVFDRTPDGSPTTVFPRGALNGYGRLPNEKWLVPPTKPWRATAHIHDDPILGVWRVEFDTGVVTGPADRPTVPAELVITPSMSEAIQPVASEDPLSPPVASNVEVWWRPVGGGSWNILGNSYSTEVPFPVLAPWPARIESDSADTEDVMAVRAVQHVRLLRDDPYPTEGQQVEVVVVHVGPPTPANPWHWEGEWGEFVRNLVRGDYSKRSPRLRYAEAAILAKRTKIRVRATGVEDDLRTVLEELHKAVGGAPALNADAELEPIFYALPPNDAALPQLENADAQPIPGWEHPSDNAITAVEVMYHRDIRVAPKADPHGDLSAGDTIASRPITVRHTAPDSVLDVMGEEDLTVDGWMFRALGNASGNPIGTLADEYGAQAAEALKARALDRFVFGGQASFFRARRAWVDAHDIELGSWLLDGRTWRPNYIARIRGDYSLSQVTRMDRVSEAWYEIEAIDAAPADQPIPLPTVGALEYVTAAGPTQHMVRIPITAATVDVEAEYAVVALGAAAPPAGDPAWTFAGRRTGPGDIYTGVVPPNRRVWVRARSVGLGRRPSPWTTPTWVETPIRPAIREVTTRLNREGVVILGVDAEETGGVRIAYEVVALSDPETVLADDEIDLAYPLAEGQEIPDLTVEVGQRVVVTHTPFASFAGGSVGGAEGAPVAVILDRPAVDPRAPTLSPRVVPGATDGLADVYLIVRSMDGATVELRGVEDSESQVWTLVEGDESEEARTVAPGEEIGPSSWWHRDGEWAQHFRDINTEEGLVRLWVEAQDGEGRLSGWTPIIVDRMALAALRLFNFRVIAEDDNGKTHGWKRGAAVRYVFVYDRLLTFEAVTAGESPWPDPDDEQALSDATILHMGTDEYSFLYPPPGRARFVQYEPRAASLASGPVIRRTVLPTSEPPDRLIGGTIRVDHLDGSVRAEVYGSQRAQSIRRAHATADEDEALTDPTDAAVEAGTVQAMTGGVVTIALPPGTVDLGERIRLRVAAYQHADGTGPGGAGDHGEIITLEATRTPYRAATLEITTEDVDPDAGEVEVGVTLHDTDAVATALYVRRSWGGGAPTAWVLLSGAPADLAEYLSDAPLEPGHDTTFWWRLHQVHRGQEIVTMLTSPGYSYGRIPDGVIVPRISHNAIASATTIGNHDVKSWRILAGDEPPAIEDVRNSGQLEDGRNVTPSQWGTLHEAEHGDGVYWAALAYSEPGGQGRESALITAEAVAQQAQPNLQVVLEVEGQGGETHFEEDDPTIRWGLHVVSPFDPGARGRELWVRYREGSADPQSTMVAGELISTAVDPNTDYAWKVSTEEGHGSWIAWDLLYHWNDDDTSEFWESFTVTSAIFTAGRVPDFTLFSPYEDEGEVGALMRGNANTLAFRVLAARGAPPPDADVRASTLRPATNRILDTEPGLLDPPLEPGETAWLKAFAYELATGDGGKESTEPAVGRVRRSAGDDETIRNYIIGISEVRWVLGGGPSGTFDTQALEIRLRYPPAVHTIEVTYGDLEAGAHDEVSGTYDFAVGATIARTERLKESDGTTVQEWSATYPVPVQIILRAYGDAAKTDLLAERFVEFSEPQIVNASAGIIMPSFPVEA